MAHSLGAIICFDILANQTGWTEASIPPPSSAVPAPSPIPVKGSDVPCDGSRAPQDGSGDEVPKVSKGSMAYFKGSTSFPRLEAFVENVFCLGSPIGMFLMIRGQHRSLGKDFQLPGCKRLFNIFHPYDPVAFRLEPLLCGSVGERKGVGWSCRDPEILPTWTGGLRVHYQVKRWWSDLWNSAWETKRRLEASIERKLEELGLIDDSLDDTHDNLFRSGTCVSCLLAARQLIGWRNDRSNTTWPKRFPHVLGRHLSPARMFCTLMIIAFDHQLCPSPTWEKAPLNACHARCPPCCISPMSGHSACLESNTLDAHGRPGRRIDGQGKGQGQGQGQESHPAWGEFIGWGEEDVEKNGRLAGGRRSMLPPLFPISCFLCVQEKEIEVTNEYIFALGAHVIYWTSKDLSLFVAKQVMEPTTTAPPL
ncbi:unnamed protein product [Discosporangium mesarthrocarpum]